MEKVELLKDRLIVGAKGKAILFAGAGCSFDCLSFQNKALPTANPLLGLFNEKLGKKISRLDVAAGMFLDKDRQKYLELLNDTFMVKSVPDDLVEIMAYKWDRVYTTNYDNALEVAALRAGKQARAIVPSDDYNLQPKNNLQIVHLHGYIEKFNAENVGRDCILDYSSNVANEVYKGRWAEKLRNDIVTSDVVVFIGYSLYDPEIAKLIIAADYSKEKIFFINSSGKNDELEYVQKKYGHPKEIERDGFAKILNSASRQSGKVARQSYVCFEKPPETLPNFGGVKQSDLTDLFLFGVFNWEAAQTTMSLGTESYVIERSASKAVLKRLDEGADFISVYAPLGHGKSVFSRMLASALRAKGRPVFIATRNQDEFADELHEITTEYSQPIIIFDDFFRYTKHWDTIAALGGQKVRIVATARVNVYSSREAEIEEKFLQHSPEARKLDELSVEEGKALVPLITQAGLWESNAALKDYEKLNIIRGKNNSGYQNNFADILIGLMKSSDIVSRFRKELLLLKETSHVCYEGVLLIMYLEFSNNDPDVTLLQEGFGNDLREFINHVETGEILKVFLIPDSAGIRYRSSIFSKYALEHACDPDDVIDVVEKTVARLAISPDISNDYSRLLADLMRFNYLKSLCKDGNFDRTFDFYDRLSAIPKVNKDDLFWNAFGMCERARHRFPAARKHFYTSIANGKNRGPNYVPYHAQNQLIVCILEAGIESSISTSDAHRDLMEVVRLLRAQADDERSNGTGQAFAWYKQFTEFFERYFKKFEDNQKRSAIADIKRYNHFIRTKVQNWQDRPGAARMVAETDNMINQS